LSIVDRVCEVRDAGLQPTNFFTQYVRSFPYFPGCTAAFAYAACNLHNKRCREQQHASVVTSFTHTADIDSG